MTFEELKSEAEEWVNKNKPVQDDWEDSDIIQAIIDTSEPREKRIVELENENALFKGRNEGFEKQIMGLLIKYEEFYKRFPDLKSAMDKAEEVLKENAELKEKNNNLVASSKTIISLSDEIETRTMKQLTKAEEIIRTLYFIIQGRIDYEDNIQIKDSMDLAKAFLNEVK